MKEIASTTEKTFFFPASYLTEIADKIIDKRYGDLMEWALSFNKVHKKHVTPEDMAAILDHALVGQEVADLDLNMAKDSKLVIVYPKYSPSGRSIVFTGALDKTLKITRDAGYCILNPLCSPTPIISPEFIAKNKIEVSRVLINQGKLFTYRMACTRGGHHTTEFCAEFPMWSFRIVNHIGDVVDGGVVFSMEDL